MNSISGKCPVYPGTEEVLEGLLQRARALIEDHVTPRRALGQCLRALGPVLTFISGQPALRAEPALSAEIGRAVLRIAQELESPSNTPLRVELPLSVEHEEAIRTGVLLLAAYRAAVEHAGGQGFGLSQRVATEFGLFEALRARDGALIADGIARFLSAAARYPEAAAAGGLTPRQLAGLAAQERVLRAHLAQRRAQAVTPGLPQRIQILHLCLEHFLDRFEAALGARLFEQPAYSSCRLTDSGRLIF